MYKEIFAENDAFMKRYLAVKPYITGLMLKGKGIGLDPEDIESDLMYKLVDISRAYRDDRGAKFVTYAIACLRNEYNEIVSRHMAKKRNSGKRNCSLDAVSSYNREANVTLMDCLAANVDDPFEECWKKECCNAIKSFFNNFGDEKIRRILYLSYQGVKQSDIAREYNCAQSLVSFYLKKFRQELREFLIENEYLSA